MPALLASRSAAADSGLFFNFLLFVVLFPRSYAGELMTGCLELTDDGGLDLRVHHAGPSLKKAACIYFDSVNHQCIGSTFIKSDDDATVGQRPCDIYQRTGTPCAAARTCQLLSR
eukprot:SAG31_NODE_1262_length_9072_cov_11.697760_1_plen_115_part_00